jgi:hypothetical protein
LKTLLNILKSIFLKPFFFHILTIAIVYLSNFLVNKLNKLYNLCLYILLRLELNYLTVESQQELLEPLNLMPFKYRLFYRFSLFSHKILNKHFLLNISDLLKPIVKTYSTREKNTNLFEVPLILSNSGAKRISVVLSMMVNKVLRTEMCNRPRLVIDLVIDYDFFQSNRNRNRSFLQNSNRNRNPVKKNCVWRLQS